MGRWDRRNFGKAHDSIVTNVVERIQAAAKHLGIDGDVVPFGSHTNTLCNANSDCDVTFVPREDVWGEAALHILKLIAQELPSHGFKSIIHIFQASIPIIKAIDPGGVEVDLCIGNHLGIHNSRLVAAYCQLDRRVGEVCRLVKQWAKSEELVSISDGHLTSYAYTLLTLYFLMKSSPPLLPNLQDLAFGSGHDSVAVVDRKWGQKMTWECKFWEDVELLPKRGFFRFYTEEFDWSTHAVCVRLATPKQDVSKFNLAAPATKEGWFIEDPFDLRHNLASNCIKEGRQRILARMAEALRLLEEGGLQAFHSYRSSKKSKFMLKCRIHVEKVSVEDFKSTITTSTNLKDAFDLHFPSSATRNKEVADAFIIFKSKESQRQVHELNERMIGEWQLRLMPCSTWALQDALAAGEYQHLEVAPKISTKPENVADQVRNGYRSATSIAEVKQLIELARSNDLKYEEQLGLKRLKQLESSGQAPSSALATPAKPTSEDEAESRAAYQ
ncbi:unnamed protein product [Durusdinium trenchii]|uniref:Uncharacterized protein n=2 Tax=Durusdinium trenchii TaxID=1381693 RepID=A0ABP0PRN6_9DINO